MSTDRTGSHQYWKGVAEWADGLRRDLAQDPGEYIPDPEEKPELAEETARVVSHLADVATALAGHYERNPEPAPTAHDQEQREPVTLMERAKSAFVGVR